MDSPFSVSPHFFNNINRPAPKHADTDDDSDADTDEDGGTQTPNPVQTIGA
jgi:hypothetical protein